LFSPVKLFCPLLDIANDIGGIFVPRWRFYQCVREVGQFGSQRLGFGQGVVRREVGCALIRGLSGTVRNSFTSDATLFFSSPTAKRMSWAFVRIKSNVNRASCSMAVDVTGRKSSLTTPETPSADLLRQGDDPVRLSRRQEKLRRLSHQHDAFH